MTTSAYAPAVAFVGSSIAAGLAEWARAVLASGAALTRAQRQLLWDLQRRDRRYGFTTLEECADVCRTLGNDSALWSVPGEVVRLRCMPPRLELPPKDVLEVEETEQEGRTNLSQLRARLDGTLAARHAEIADLIRQREATQQLIARCEMELEAV